MSPEMSSTALHALDVVGRNNVHFRVESFLGDSSRLLPGPQVFLVRQGPNSVLDAHFHAVSQFQLFTRGEATLGRKPIATPVVHYADPWTTYGPISADDAGIDYFTIRMQADVGAGFMPESRVGKPRSGRSLSIHLDMAGDEGSWGSRTLYSDAHDGLALHQVAVAPGHRPVLPPLTGAGRLFTILVGALDVEGRRHGEGTWGRAPDPSLDVSRAGELGAQLLCFDFPVSSL